MATPAITTPPKVERFKQLLRELFMFDQADLDFGIYRIMNAKRDEITRFLDNDLLPQVADELKKLGGGDRVKLEAEYSAAVETARKFGAPDPENAPPVLDLKKKLETAVDTKSLEEEIFSDLFNFFRRYYSQGDFMSLRRYKEGVYAIPYEGEEVKLHWANADQYYIKTSEYLRDYTFKLGDGRRVHFKLVGGDTEQNNNKPATGDERRFVVSESDAVLEDEGELVIRFEFRPDPDKRKQTDLNKMAVENIFSSVLVVNWLAGLGEKKPTEKNQDRTLLEKRLSEYTARNTFDYFIHKDLGPFLRRELDFFIKNEILHLDDVEHETDVRVQEKMAKVRGIRHIAHKIIALLEQLENFQKRLWLKKKFVVGTHYCITLDRIPQELYLEIAANDAQREEWVRLFNIDKTQANLATPGYSTPLTKDFLTAHPFLAIDTAHFSDDFCYRLLNGIDHIDEQIDGVMIHSENFQALALLKPLWGKRLRCIYIDPPFNLGTNADFLYRTDYKDSTWASLLYDRLILASQLLTDRGFIYVRCDINGNHLVRFLLDKVFGASNFRAELLVQRIRKNVTGQGSISMPLANDSLFLYSSTPEAELVDPFLTLPQARVAYWRRMDDSAGYRNPPERTIFGVVFHPYKKDAHFKFSQDTVDRMIVDGRVRLRCKNCGEEHCVGKFTACGKCGSIEATPQYLVEETDKQVLDTNWTDIAGYAHTTGFATENSEVLLRRAIQVASDNEDCVLDFFSGSGTTQAAALEMGRRWIGTESGSSFDQHILPRLKRRYKSMGRGGCFKYLRLESYEDSLNNLELQRSVSQQFQLDVGAKEQAREHYLLRYMLDIESRGNRSLIHLEGFSDPTSFRLKIRMPGSDEVRDVAVDLIETFNWLLGLTVEHIASPQTFDAVIEKEGDRPLRLKGNISNNEGGPWWFRSITGSAQDGERVLVIWRKLTGDSARDNLVLDQWFTKRNYSTKDYEFDIIYVNGDNNLENLRKDDETWKVRLIEEEFLRLMFEGTEA